MNRFVRVFLLTVLLVVTFAVRTYHFGVFPKPVVDESITPKEAVWIPKEKFGMHQMILQGSPYERGLQSGKLTAKFLELQEDDLVKQLRTWIPSDLILQSLIVTGILWFQGIDRYFESWMVEEMYGVSKSAPHKYDDLSDGLTRQIAYHGLHEVGQMVVDSGFEGMGCTLAAVPWQGSWILGRNFDFEAGRVFDTDKIVKWVFPDHGHAYVSVIWAGMVGAVTGANDQGMYISLNAAGSSDFRRLGTPSTLVVLKVLQEASSAKEALKIIEEKQMFITDIMVLLDSKTGELFRVEKSPAKMEIIPIHEPHLVANHLIGKTWDDDETNKTRKKNITTLYRQERGEKILAEIAKKNISSAAEMELEVLKVIRDKGEADGKPLHLGNRRAIDALIATHSVVFNGKDGILYVSRGPGVSGAFTGFDLKKSFEQKTPIAVGELPADPLVSEETFDKVRASGKELSFANALIRKKKCDEASSHLEKAAQMFQEQHYYYEVLGNWHQCRNEKDLAKAAWEKSLALHPAYRKTVESLEKKLEKKVQEL